MTQIFDTIRNGFLNIISGIVAYAPSVLTAAVIILLGWLVARLLRNAIIRVADRIKLNDIVDRTGLTAGLRQADIKQTPAQIIGALIYWIVFLNFLLAALRTIGLQAALQPLEDFIGFLPQIVAGLVTLIAGSLLVQFVARAVQGALASMGVEFHQTLGSVVQVVLMGILIIIVIDQMGLDVTLLRNMFTNVVTIIAAGAGLAFGLGGRSVARNVLAGFYARDLFEPGDTLELDGEQGVLEGIGTLNAELRSGNGVIVVPNTRLMEEKVRVVARSDASG